jgi:hypothetical protein
MASCSACGERKAWLGGGGVSVGEWMVKVRDWDAARLLVAAGEDCGRVGWVLGGWGGSRGVHPFPLSITLIYSPSASDEQKLRIDIQNIVYI